MFILDYFCYNIKEVITILGENIRKKRKDKNLTMKELGIRIGLSEQAIGNYERGDREPSIDILNKIANALDVNIYDLLDTTRRQSNDIGSKITLLSDIQKISDQELCEAIGIDSERLNSIKNSSVTPSLEELKQIANYFKKELVGFLHTSSHYIDDNGNIVEEFVQCGPFPGYLTDQEKDELIIKQINEITVLKIQNEAFEGKLRELMDINDENKLLKEKLKEITQLSTLNDDFKKD